MLHPYRTEPIRPALIMAVVVLAAALLAPNPGLRVLILILLSGPLAWAFLQVARRGRGVLVEADRLGLQAGVLRRSLTIRAEQLQVWDLLSGGQLAVAYLQPRRAEPGDEPRPPRLRLYITPALADPHGLAAALPSTAAMSVEQLHWLVLWRRIRRLIFVMFGLFAGVPALVILLARIVGVVTGALGGH